MAYTFRTLTAALARAGVPEPTHEALLLIERFGGASPAEILCDRDRPLPSEALDRAAEGRLSRLPLAYLLGVWDFLGCPFRVSPACLIPRPDTETLAEEAIRSLPPRARVADLGTGSGCLAIAVLVRRPDVSVHALDLSAEALRLAEENAVLNGVRDRFFPVRADILNGGTEALSPFAPFEAILSNPPYIRSADLDSLEPEVRAEPREALDGGGDGLRFHRAILRDYPALTRPGGQILLEIGRDQAAEVASLTRSSPLCAGVRILRDLEGRDRVAVVRVAPDSLDSLDSLDCSEEAPAGKETFP